MAAIFFFAHILYFVICFALLFIFKIAMRTRFILGGIIIVFPFVDFYIPQISFKHYCSQNLKFVNKLPIKDVAGFYSEGYDGTCQLCSKYYLDHYKYIEGRINKNRSVSSDIDLNDLIKDKHKSLYRFTLISIDTDKTRLNCDQTNIVAQRKIFKKGNLDKIRYY